MDEQARQMMARALLGQGMLGQAADLKKWQPLYQQANIEAQQNGMQLPPIQEWIKQQQTATAPQ